jgi:pheromone shutdown-related protein TraB
MPKIHIIGTSHIAKESIDKIKESINKINPNFIAVELDKNRLYSLENNIQTKPSIKLIKIIGFQGYLFSLIGGYLQKKLGNIVGIKPGSDMLTAVKTAKEKNIKIALIDQPIEITMKRFSKLFSFKDKISLLKDIIKGIFSKKHRIKFDLTKVPEEKLIEKLIETMRINYPGLYQSLIHERNIYMAKRIENIAKNNTESIILVVIGAGHKKGIIEELHKIFKQKG